MTLTCEKTSFDAFDLNSKLLETIQKMGYQYPTPIQEQAIPSVLLGLDIVGQAETGTGKTAAFGLPLIEMLSAKKHAFALVLTPTRELAAQVAEELNRFARASHLKVATICGGKSFKNQIEALKNGTHIIVATPGRLLDLLSKKNKTFLPTVVVLDEADEMLNMGFLEDVQAILDSLPEERQTLLFSATLPKSIKKLIDQFLKKPNFIKTTQAQVTNRDIDQAYCLVSEKEKDLAIMRFLSLEEFSKSMIFCRTKVEVDRVVEVLTNFGLNVRGLHGDMTQAIRDKTIQDFRKGRLKALIATDVAARGINIEDISHVINYHIPSNAEGYVHRIGRTGRAGKKGSAISFVNRKEKSKLMQYGKILGGDLQEIQVPTKQELKQAFIEDLRNQIIEASAKEEDVSFLQSLEETVELKSIARGMLSLLLKQKTFHGPESIGIQDAEPKHKDSKRRKRGFAKDNFSFRSAKKDRFKSSKKRIHLSSGRRKSSSRKNSI